MLAPTPARTYEAVRASIDAKLGDGLGMPTAEAAAKLEGVEEAVWVLDNLLASVFEFRLHIWDQGFRGAGYDGPAVLAGIAEVVRSAHPCAADLLAWTARWVTTRGVPMSSVVPEVWVAFATDARRMLIDVAERWSGAVPRADPSTWSRVPPSSVSVGFTAAGAACAYQCVTQTRDGVFRGVLSALWQAGESDATLDAFFKSYFAGDAVEVDVVCRFVSFDGDGGDADRKAALQAAIRPVDQLAAVFGLDALEFPSLLRIASIDRIAGKCGDVYALKLPGPELFADLRHALRQNPDIAIFEAAMLKSTDLEMFVAALHTGHILIAVGDSPVLTELAAAAQLSIRDAVSI